MSSHQLDRQALLTVLLEKNHRDHAMLLSDGATHSHMAHILISAYKLHASKGHLQDVFNNLAPALVPYTATGVPIESDEQLFGHLGDKAYQRAFVEYFDRRLQDFDGDWKALIIHYLVQGPKPMLGGLVGGFAHPLILLSDAIDAGSPEVAVEALALTATDWNALHAVIEADSLGDRPGDKRSVVQVLDDMRKDARFDGIMSKPGVANTMIILQNSVARQTLLEHMNAFDLKAETPDEVVAVLREMIDAAVLLLCTVQVHPAAPEALCQHKFDFYLTHQLTFCWCLQILIPFLPPTATPKLLRTGWLMMALTYATALRPNIKPELLTSTPLPDEKWSETWDRMIQVALGATKDRGMDPHFVKVIRTLKEFAQQWPDREEIFLKACVRFESEFGGWTGFGAGGDEELSDVKL